MRSGIFCVTPTPDPNSDSRTVTQTTYFNPDFRFQLQLLHLFVCDSTPKLENVGTTTTSDFSFWTFSTLTTEVRRIPLLPTPTTDSESSPWTYSTPILTLTLTPTQMLEKMRLISTPTPESVSDFASLRLANIKKGLVPEETYTLYKRKDRQQHAKKAVTLYVDEPFLYWIVSF